MKEEWVQSDAFIGWRAVGWWKVTVYLMVTFAITWGLQVGIDALAQSCAMPDSSPPLGMLVPALVAILYRMYIDRKSNLHFAKCPRSPRLLMIAYVAFAAFLAGVVLFENARCLSPGLSRWVASIGPVLWTLLALNLYPRDKGESFQSAGLGLGSANVGARIVLAFVCFLLLQPLLNWVLGLGQIQGTQALIAGIDLPNWSYPIGVIGLLLITITGGPLGSLIFTFGEEFGWRGFLQDELEGLGRLPAAIVVGIIWWAWHIPIILSGVHTYAPTPLGLGLALVFFILWGIMQSYAVWKTGSVWTAAFTHGLVNGLYAFTLQYLVRPENKILSFGLGIYGLLLMLVVVLWLRRDPVWRARQAPAATPVADQNS